jgi:3-dehydroquinate dehydratase-2
VRIAVINGPNLNLLGVREPSIYGTETLSDVERRLQDVARELSVSLEFVQRNGEGELVEYIHGLRGRVDGAIVNAGAYSHSSLAIRDALTGVAMPFIEVHISNVFGREPERRHSMLAPAAIGIVCGLGTYGYDLALRGLAAKLSARSNSQSAARV